MAQAAFNLCVITSKDRMEEAVAYCKKAVELRPQEPRHAYTLAFCQLQKGDERTAVTTLEKLIQDQPAYADAYILLGGTYERQGKKDQAEEIYKKGLESERVSDLDKSRIAAHLESLKGAGNEKK